MSRYDGDCACRRSDLIFAAILLGKPSDVAVYPMTQETVWSWTWRESSLPQKGYFNMHFGADHTVPTTSRSDVMCGHECTQFSTDFVNVPVNILGTSGASA
ncbi:hypothetical protein [Mycetohabitans sp. B46]|uniref:hypothetical protein n=1 Tax=Mycetohabitans sp. B46 TaxID=2772536 RepID=UPI00307E93A2